MRTRTLRSATLAGALSAAAWACRPAASPAHGARAVSGGTAADSVTGATISVRQLQSLRWIEGTWRGEGGGVAPFTERYRFVNDSTLLVDDPTSTTAEPATEFALRDGRFGSMGRARWEAVQLIGGAVTFAPVRGARNYFVWRPISRDEWVAELSWLPPLDTTRAPQTPRRYRMRRVGP